jgi:hypothetical protein
MIEKEKNKISRLCALCQKELKPYQKTYCSKKCCKKGIYKNRMSKLCPQCRKNYIYVGSKRCLDCQKKKNHSQVCRSFRPSNFRKRYTCKDFKICPICKIRKIRTSNTTCSNSKCKKRATAVAS